MNDSTKEILSNLENIQKQLSDHQTRLQKLEDRVAAKYQKSQPEARDLSHITKLKSEPKASVNWKIFEENFGKYILQSLGVIVLLLGMIFFLKYSFDQGFITPITRVIIGTIIGSLLVVGGEFLHRRKLWSLASITGGLALYYLSWYSAYSFYGLISMTTAWELLGLITLLTAFFAIRYDVFYLALCGAFAAYLSPFFIGSAQIFRAVSPEIYGYALSLSAMYIALGFLKKWHSLAMLSFLCTLALNPFFSSYPTLILDGLMFTLFALTPYLYSVIWKKVTPSQWALISLFAGIISILLFANHAISLKISFFQIITTTDLALLFFMFGVLYFGKLIFLFWRNTKDILLLYTLTVLSLFLTITIALNQLSNLSLGIFSLYLLYVLFIIFKFSTTATSQIAITISSLFGIALLNCGFYFLSFRVQKIHLSFFNVIHISIIAAIAIMVATIYLLIKRKHSISSEQREHLLKSLATIGATIIIIWLTAPLWAPLYSIASLTIFACTLLTLSLTKGEPYLLTSAILSGLFAFTRWASVFREIIVLGLWDQPAAAHFNDLIKSTIIAYNTATTIIIFSLLATLYYLKKIQRPSQAQVILINAFIATNSILIFLCIKSNLLIFLNPNHHLMAITIFYGIFSVTTLLIGIIKKKILLRYIGLAGAFLTFIKLILYAFTLSDIIYRMISFLVIGILFILASFIYQRLGKIMA